MADKVNPIQVQKYLKGLDYPVGRDELVKQAQQGGADDNIRQLLEKLPDQQFQTPADVSKAIGQAQ